MMSFQIMDRKVIILILTTICLIIFPAISECAMSEENSCEQQGIVVRNLHTAPLWYKMNDGNCVKWRRSHLFTINTQDTLEIFSDMCTSLFCSAPLSFADLKSYDTDGNCRVRILRGCSISDM